jgi:hypothetical protein
MRHNVTRHLADTQFSDVRGHQNAHDRDGRHSPYGLYIPIRPETWVPAQPALNNRNCIRSCHNRVGYTWRDNGRHRVRKPRSRSTSLD